MKQAFLISCLVLCVVGTQAQIRIYPLDGDGTETVGGFDGILGAGAAEPSDTTDRYGAPGGALYFNGDDHVEIPVAGLINTDFSVSAWLLVSVNPPNLQMDYYAVGDAAQDQAFGVANDQFGIGFFQAGYVDAGSPVRVFQGNMPTEDIWYHVVVTRSSTELRLYINGWLSTAVPTSGTVPVYGAAPLAFIGNRNVNLRPWNGIIDDLRIWDRALSAQEVQLVNAVPETAAGEVPQLFPNPAGDELFVLLPASAGRPDALRIFDGTGRMVMHQRMPLAPSSIVPLPVAGLAAGYYVLEVAGPAATLRRAWIKN